MNSTKILARILELVFPERVERIKAERTAKRTAMQALLDANRRLRQRDASVEYINGRLYPAMYEYKCGNYAAVAERAEFWGK